VTKLKLKKIAFICFLCSLSSASYSQGVPSFEEHERLKTDAVKFYTKFRECSIKLWLEKGEDELKWVEDVYKKATTHMPDVIETAFSSLIIKNESCPQEKERAAYSMFRYIASTGGQTKGYLREKDSLYAAQLVRLKKEIGETKNLRFGR
jgi:hypothetical protein